MAAVLAVVALFGWPQLRGGTTVPGDNLAGIPPWKGLVARGPANELLVDPLVSVYPFRKLVNDEVQAGRFPLWNPYLFAGHSMAAEPDTALFYPATLGLAWLSPGSAFDTHILIHILLSALGMYVLVRVWGGGSLGGIVAAAAFCGGSVLTVWRLYGNLTSVAAWLPWLLVCFEMSRRRRALVWIGAGGVVLGLILTANFVQWALYDLFLLAIYAGWTAVGEGRAGRPPARPLVQAAAIVVLGLAIGAVQLLPLSELAALSTRSTPLDYERLRRFALSPAKLATVLAPDFFGTPVHPGSTWGPDNYAESTMYWGFTPFLLSLTAPLWQRRRPVLFLWAFLLLAVSLAIGAPTLRVFALLPGYNLLAPARLTYLICFCGAALAGLCWEAAFADPRRWRTLGVLGAPAVVGVAALWIVAERLPSPAAKEAALASVHWAVALTAAGLVVLAAAVASVRFARFVAPAMAAVAIVDLASFSLPYAPRPVEERDLFPRPAAFSALPPSIVPPRLAAIDEGRGLFFPNTLMPLGVAQVGGYSSLVPADGRRFLRRLNQTRGRSSRMILVVTNPRSPLLDLAGVEYLASLSPLDTGDGRLVLLSSDGFFLYRNRAAAPRAFIVAGVRPVGRQATWRELASEDFTPCRTATVPITDPDLPPAADGEGCVGRAMITSYEGNRVRVRTESPRDGLLVLTDAYYPGWVATVDGVQRPIHRADGIFRGVWLPAGRHEVVFRFRPARLMAGGALSVLGLAVAAGLVLFGRARGPTAGALEAQSATRGAE